MTKSVNFWAPLTKSVHFWAPFDKKCPQTTYKGTQATIWLPQGCILYKKYQFQVPGKGKMRVPQLRLYYVQTTVHYYLLLVNMQYMCRSVIITRKFWIVNDNVKITEIILWNIQRNYCWGLGTVKLNKSELFSCPYTV